MQSYLFRRSFSFVSIWCFALSVLGISLIQAAEFKPFLTLKIDSPEKIINIVEKVGGLVDTTGALGIKAMLTPYKRLPGVKSDGMIGLALQRNENSPIMGLDIVLFLPVSNVESFNIPGQEPIVGQVKGMLRKEGDRFMISSPFGDFVAYQKKDYFVVAPMNAAEIASAAEPKDLFADLSKFTLGLTVNLANLSLEDIEALLGNLAGILATQGMGEGLNVEEVFAAVKQTYEQTSVWTEGITIDERTLNCTASRLTVPKKDSPSAEKFSKIKGAKTMFGGFLQDTSKTVFSWSYIDHLMDSEIAELTAALQLLGGSFIEGLSEATGEEGGGGEQFTRLAEIILAWFQENVDYLAQNRSVDYAFSLDTDGTFLYAQTMTQPELTTKIGSDLYNALPELLGAEQGDALQQLIGSKIKLDYDTVAGFSLSGLSNLFADIPPEIAVPQKIKDLPVNLYWAVKEKEAVAIAVGLDAVRTERALRTALGKTNALVTPKQTAVFAMKPTGEFLSRQVLPLMIKSGTDQTIIDENREFFPVLAGAESSAKVIVTTEFPNDAHLQKWQIDGRCFTTLLKLYAKQNELTAKRMVLEQQKQLLEQQRQELQEQPEAQESPVKPEPPVQEEEMQNPFDE